MDETRGKGGSRMAAHRKRSLLILGLICALTLCIFSLWLNHQGEETAKSWGSPEENIEIYFGAGALPAYFLCDQALTLRLLPLEDGPPGAELPAYCLVECLDRASCNEESWLYVSAPVFDLPSLNSKGWVKAKQSIPYTGENRGRLIYPVGIAENAKCYALDNEAVSLEGLDLSNQPWFEETRQGKEFLNYLVEERRDGLVRLTAAGGWSAWLAEEDLLYPPLTIEPKAVSLRVEGWRYRLDTWEALETLPEDYLLAGNLRNADPFSLEPLTDFSAAGLTTEYLGQPVYLSPAQDIACVPDLDGTGYLGFRCCWEPRVSVDTAETDLFLIGTAVFEEWALQRAGGPAYQRPKDWVLTDIRPIAGDLEEFRVRADYTMTSSPLYFMPSEGISGSAVFSTSLELRIRQVAKRRYQLVSVGTGGDGDGLALIGPDKIS